MGGTVRWSSRARRSKDERETYVGGKEVLTASLSLSPGSGGPARKQRNVQSDGTPLPNNGEILPPCIIAPW